MIDHCQAPDARLGSPQACREGSKRVAGAARAQKLELALDSGRLELTLQGSIAQ